mgnify:CR=1 FL=1
MAKPAGRWNTMRITARGSCVEVRLNGEQVVDVDLAETSRAERSGGGRGPAGDHRLDPWFRNIRIKELE